MMYKKCLMSALLLATGVMVPSQDTNERESNYVLMHVKDKDCPDIIRFITLDPQSKKPILGGVYVSSNSQFDCDHGVPHDRVEAIVPLFKDPNIRNKIKSIYNNSRYVDESSCPRFLAKFLFGKYSNAEYENAEKLYSDYKRYIGTLELEKRDESMGYPRWSIIGWNEFLLKNPDLAQQLETTNSSFDSEEHNMRLRVFWGSHEVLERYLKNGSSRDLAGKPLKPRITEESGAVLFVHKDALEFVKQNIAQAE